MVSELGLIEGVGGGVWAFLCCYLGLTKPFYAFLCQGLERLIEA